MFTKGCIVAAAGPVPLHIRGIPTGAGNDAGSYAPLDYRGGARSIFHTITIISDFGSSFRTILNAAANAFNAGAVAGRLVAQFFQQNADPSFIRYAIGDDYYNHDKTETVVAGLAVEHAFSLGLFADMTTALTGDAYVFKIPTDFFDREPPFLRSEITGVPHGSEPGVYVEEPLLGFSGMSTFRPSGIFPLMDKLPPMIQDYNYAIDPEATQLLLVDPISSRLHEAGISDQLFAFLNPRGNYELTVRSEDGFDQSTKELQRADIPYPFIQEFRSKTAVIPGYLGGGRPSCECITPYGPPDFVFLRIQREFANAVCSVPFEPVIKTLAMSIRYQDVKTVSDMDANQLFQVTRKNSNFRADSVQNHIFICGSFLVFSHSPLLCWNKRL